LQAFWNFSKDAAKSASDGRFDPPEGSRAVVTIGNRRTNSAGVLI
jgi:hypothetical protein